MVDLRFLPSSLSLCLLLPGLLVCLSHSQAAVAAMSSVQDPIDVDDDIANTSESQIINEVSCNLPSPSDLS